MRDLQCFGAPEFEIVRKLSSFLSLGCLLLRKGACIRVSSYVKCVCICFCGFSFQVSGCILTDRKRFYFSTTMMRMNAAAAAADNDCSQTSEHDRRGIEPGDFGDA